MHTNNQIFDQKWKIKTRQVGALTFFSLLDHCVCLPKLFCSCGWGMKFVLLLMHAHNNNQICGGSNSASCIPDKMILMLPLIVLKVSLVVCLIYTFFHRNTSNISVCISSNSVSYCVLSAFYYFEHTYGERKLIEDYLQLNLNTHIILILIYTSMSNNNVSSVLGPKNGYHWSHQKRICH